ncbi:MAG: hypothetical protein J6Q81_03470 [Lentisphaeria bacterium]|nr:hypothetical protein [Lentisphaeria bacterium]
MRYFCILLLLTGCLALRNVNAGEPQVEKVVRYEDFGARGDGVTDDQKAIVAAHAYANKHNLPVKGKAGARYYIGSGSSVAIIKTDTDFNNAEFIIDDRNAKNYQKPIFQLQPDKPDFKLKKLKSLKKSQKSLNMTFPGKVLLLLQNNKQNRFSRLRKNRPIQKNPQRDVICVDKQGNIDQSAPLLWDFDFISECLVHYIPGKTVTVKNGIFTTVANSKNDKDGYFARNISVKRSNVVFDNIVHKVRETPAQHRYMASGFIAVRDCGDITIKNSAFTGDKRYFMLKYPQSLSGGYDLTLWRAFNVKFINCRQLNDIYDSSFWGIIGTNYCKNIYLDNCRFSRFDAHMGVYNATIKNCTLGHQGISVTGFGTLLVENTSVKSNSFINLRADYGSFWQGRIIIRNSQFTPVLGNRPRPVAIIGGVNQGEHDFGYTCYLPEFIEIDGLAVNDKSYGKKTLPISLLADFNYKYKSNQYKEKYPVVKPRMITVKNLKINTGKYILSRNKYMFQKVKVVKK